MTPAERVEFAGQRKGHQIVVNRQQFRLAKRQPFCDFVVAALRAVAVAAGAPDEVLRSAVWTAIERAAPHFRSAAGNNVAHGMMLLVVQEPVQILMPAAENVRQFRHGNYSGRLFIRFSIEPWPSLRILDVKCV